MQYHNLTKAQKERKHEQSRQSHARKRQVKAAKVRRAEINKRHRERKKHQAALKIRAASRAASIGAVVPAQRLAEQYRAWLKNGGRGPDPFELRDAAHECKHGRLPHDAWRDPDCSCWK